MDTASQQTASEVQQPEPIQQHYGDGAQTTSIGAQISAYTHKSMALREIRDYTQHLAGRIKTIIDAAIVDPRQNKATKDLVHEAFWAEHYNAVKDWCESVATDDNIHAFPFATDHQVPMSL